MAVRVMLLLVVALAANVMALNNGLGLTPAMGFSSWNAFSSNVTSTGMRQALAKLVSSGLAAKGYNHLNVDEGWLKSRDSSGGIVSDDVKFPEGMKACGDWVHSQEHAPGQYFKYGLYTCRGTCQCSTSTYHGPGSHGYEVQDAQYMADAGADYVKEDHETAFADYGRMRDALNATGRPIYFSLCGWNTWYAPVGYGLGNSWRISGDGSSWAALTSAMNKMNNLTRYNGPGGWNDPDLLIGPDVKVGGQTDLQSRTQFSLWTLFPAPLIISNDLTKASDYAIETWGNEEVHIRAEASRPIDNGMSIEVVACNAEDPLQQWTYNPVNHTLGLKGSPDSVLDNLHCDHSDGNPIMLYPADNGAGTCAGRNQQWVLHDDQTITNVDAQKCLDAYNFVGPAVDIWTCNGGNNQQWLYNASTSQLVSASSGKCLTAVNATTTCTNTWGRRMRDGSWAVAMVNNLDSNATVTCGADCFGQTTLGSAPALVVRDLWAHQNITTLRPSAAGYSLSQTVPGQGGVRYFRLYPTAE